MDVGGWLRGLGLGQYEEKFRDNKLDAEDWRNLVNAYLDEASAAVTGLGGHVLKKLGDGLMALFGYPRAQENDAERAVRAALAIQRALADLNARNPNGAPE